MTPNPADGQRDHDDDPWSPARYEEAREQNRVSGTGFRLSGQAVMLIFGVLLGIVITIVYAAYLLGAGG